MIDSRRTFLAISLLATTSMPGASFAHASSPTHVPGNRNAIHLQEHFRLTNRHLPGNHQAQPRQQVEDPFADLILG
ncbi:hypothetical protein ABIB73_001803 [Bradyrhizobium sp. F1.4.3]